MGSIVLQEADKYAKDGRKLNPVEQIIFFLLKNSEKNYGVNKESLYQKLIEANPFGNIKSHSITSIAMLH
jgi:hypothetical protein